jgi:hypothetical protein
MADLWILTMAVIRDPATGRVLPGSVLNPKGPPRAEDAERIRQAVTDLLDPVTMAKWSAAMRRKLAKGNLQATELILDRIIGKPVQGVNVSGDARLQAFMVAWSQITEGAAAALAGALSAQPDPLLLDDGTQAEEEESPADADDST